MDLNQNTKSFSENYLVEGALVPGYSQLFVCANCTGIEMLQKVQLKVIETDEFFNRKQRNIKCGKSQIQRKLEEKDVTEKQRFKMSLESKLTKPTTTKIRN